MLWVVEDINRSGGVETVVRRLDAGLKQRGVDSAVLSWLPEASEDLRGRRPRDWLLAKVRTARTREAMARAVGMDLGITLQEQTELVAILDPGSLSLARYLVGIPRWGVHMHWDPDVFFRPWRHLEGDQVPPPLVLLASARMRAVARRNVRVLRSAPFLVALTESHREQFRRIHPAIHQISNPVSVVPTEAVADHEDVTVGYVGRLSHEKGPDVLIEALARSRSLRQLRVLVAGAGPLEAEVRQRANELGLDLVEFLGWVDDARSVLRRVDVLVLPSRVEAVPLVLVEALATGCRVVASDAGSGVRDLLRAGQLGTIVPANDAVALGEAIEAAVDDVRAGHRANADLVQALVAEHTPKRVIDAWLEILDEEVRSKLFASHAGRRRPLNDPKSASPRKLHRQG